MTEPDLFNDDVRIRPVLILPGEGKKLSYAAKVFRLGVDGLRRTVKKFRIISQSNDTATIYVHLPALSMVHARDWEALKLLQDGKRDHERVKMHYDHVARLEEELHRKDVAAEKAKHGRA